MESRFFHSVYMFHLTIYIAPLLTHLSYSFTGDHIKWESSDEPFMILSLRHWADIELYMYAKHLFVEQGALFSGL